MTTQSATDAPIRAYIAELVARRRDYRQEVKDLVEKYPLVVFYGCGAILNSIVESWDEHIGRKIDYCCDSDPRKWGKIFCGARCLSPEELLALKEQCAVFVTIGSYKEVFDTLTLQGFPSVNLLFKYDLSAAQTLEEASQGDIINSLCAAYACLSDDKSRSVFQAILARVLDKNASTSLMPEICENQQYFPSDIIHLTEDEIFVDIGAYDGDTIRDFVGHTEGHFKKVYSFELDAINFKALQKNVEPMPCKDRIAIFNIGIWDVAQEITYSIGESQSTVGAGSCIGHVVPLDKALEGQAVTFIKMDIEGAEPNALRGATHLIQTHKPKLAICTYHDFKHLWEIPLYIKSLVPGYSIYLRHHTNLEYETVCYAVVNHPVSGALHDQ